MDIKKWKVKDIIVTGVTILLLLVGLRLQATILLLLIIYTHEYGHKLVAQRFGLRVEGISLNPLGAVTNVIDTPRTYRDDFFMCLAGPLSGLLVTASAFVAYQLTGYGVFIGLAGLTAAINAVNLLPLALLDGGRVLGAIFSPLPRKRRPHAMWACNALAAGALYVFGSDHIMIAILVIIGLLTSSFGVGREEYIEMQRDTLLWREADYVRRIAEKEEEDFMPEVLADLQEKLLETRVELQSTFIPLPMDRREAIVCSALLLLTLAGLTLAYVWAGPDYLKLFMS